MRILTRRTILASAAGVLAGTLPGFAKAPQPATAVNFAVPPHACDSHTHIVGDPAKFPFFPGRSYTPEPALPDEMKRLHQALHVERVVIVTPSFYGTDNSATLYGIKARGKTARGVAVIDEHTAESALDQMGNAGIRGIRINLATAGLNDPSVGRKQFQAAADRIKRLSWHIQMYTTLPVISAIKDLVESSPVPVVFDHFGGINGSLGEQQPGFIDLLALVRGGKAYVKISGVYRASKQAPDYAEMVPFARALIAANPDRILWGSDWPHPDTAEPPGKTATNVLPPLPIDDGRILNLLPVWAPDAATRKKILVDNPARLYGF